MIKAVIYDMDGLMINSEPVHIIAWNKFLSEYNHSMNELPQELRSNFIGMRLVEVVKEVVSAFKLDVDPEMFQIKRDEIFLKLMREKTESMPGLFESLKLFKENNFKIALTSSGTTEYINLILKKLDIQNYFNVIVSGNDVKTGKPDPEPYLVTTKKLELNTKECLVLEDAKNGIESAKAAGCKCIAIKNPHNPPQDLSQADVILNSLEEISLDVLKLF